MLFVSAYYDICIRIFKDPEDVYAVLCFYEMIVKLYSLGFKIKVFF